MTIWRDGRRVVTEREAWEALAGVVDPELGIDIVELGLVYGVEIDARVVAVTMTLTTAGCPLHDVIVNGVERALATRRPPGRGRGRLRPAVGSRADRHGRPARARRPRGRA